MPERAAVFRARNGEPVQSISFDERHLKGVLKEYVGYYHQSRIRLGLEKDCPEHRPIELLDEADPLDTSSEPI